MDLWSDTLSQLRSSHADTERHIIAWQSASSLPMLAVIKDFHFIHATAQTLAYFESQAENFINATPYDFSPRIQSSGRNSIEFAQHVMQEAARGSIKSFDWLHMSQQGAELPTKVTLYPASLNEQAVLIAELTPVNRRSRTRKSSRNGFECLPKQLLSIALEDSAEAVYITDSQHKIIAVNKAMCRICGYSADQLLGRNQDFIDSSRTNDVVDKVTLVLSRSEATGKVKSKCSAQMRHIFRRGKVVVKSIQSKPLILLRFLVILVPRKTRRPTDRAGAI